MSARNEKLTVAGDHLPVQGLGEVEEAGVPVNGELAQPVPVHQLVHHPPVVPLNTTIIRTMRIIKG